MVDQIQKLFVRLGFFRENDLVVHSLQPELGRIILRPQSTRHIERAKLRIAEVYRPFERRTVERGSASDFHAAEGSSPFLVPKLCPYVEITCDVRPGEGHRPFEHRTNEEVASDFHFRECGFPFLVLKLCPCCCTCLEIACDVCPDENYRSFERRIEEGVASDFHFPEHSWLFLVLKLRSLH